MSAFPEGSSLPAELDAAMEKIGDMFGVKYPPGYLALLVNHYETVEEINYPHILIRAGASKPNITRSRWYEYVKGNYKRVIDYGCGIGEDLRALVIDGFKGEAVGVDVDDNSINLGLALFPGELEMHDKFIVTNRPVEEVEKGDAVYSGSVIHCLKRKVLKNYLINAYELLEEGGIFFGSAVGVMNKKDKKKIGNEGPPNILTPKQLERRLKKAGFKDIEIYEEPVEVGNNPHLVRLWFKASK